LLPIEILIENILPSGTPKPTMMMNKSFLPNIKGIHALLHFISGHRSIHVSFDLFSFVTAALRERFQKRAHIWVIKERRMQGA
jgi:hypothetical protein